MVGDQPTRSIGRFDDRGQSVFDYSIAVSLFLVVVIGVLVFVPTAFGSFGHEASGDAGDDIAAERGADYLTGSAFASDDNSAAFRTGCTLLFFEAETSHDDVTASPPDCGFEQGATLADNVSLGANQPVNVTLEADVDSDGVRDRLCWHDDADELMQAGSCSTSTEPIALTAGTSAADNGNHVVAERYGQLNGQGVYVVVRTW